MNMRRENRCPGSGSWAGSAPGVVTDRMTCPRCGRHRICVRTDGRFYIHSKERR